MKVIWIGWDFSVGNCITRDEVGKLLIFLHRVDDIPRKVSVTAHLDLLLFMKRGYIARVSGRGRGPCILPSEERKRTQPVKDGQLTDLLSPLLSSLWERSFELRVTTEVRVIDQNESVVAYKVFLLEDFLERVPRPEEDFRVAWDDRLGYEAPT